MKPLYVSLLVVGILGFLIWLNVVIYARARRLLRDWAAKNGLEILAIQNRLFRRGPFFWTTSQSQIVFYVTVRDGGQKRCAYVRCGGYWSGLLSNKIEVAWDDF